MQALKKTLLCFQRPKPGGYIGGVVTLCNDYMDKRRLFAAQGYELDCFNYEFPNGSFCDRISFSPLRNIAYGIMQTFSLRKLLKTDGDVNIHIHTSRKALFFKDVLLARAIRKRCKGKIVMTIHVGDIATVFHNSLTRRFLIGLMNQSFDKVLFLSDRMRHQFIDSGLDEKRTEVLYNFYNISACAPAEKEHHETPEITFLGSINREKGIIELLTALTELDCNFHFNLCGTVIEPQLQPEIDRLLSQLGPKVTAHGYVDKSRKEQILKSTDILVLPSYREGLPISILEAMATSCGIITTPVGAIPEILTHENAIIIQPKDRGALQKALLELLNYSEQLALMRRANYSKAALFSEQQHISHLCRVYGQN